VIPCLYEARFDVTHAKGAGGGQIDGIVLRGSVLEQGGWSLAGEAGLRGVVEYPVGSGRPIAVPHRRYHHGMGSWAPGLRRLLVDGALGAIAAVAVSPVVSCNWVTGP
jgi:hypothetical protein